MARVTVFSYKPGNSLLHRLDPRFKLLFMGMLSLASINSGFWGLLLSSLLVLGLLAQAQVKIHYVPKELKIFPWFLLFIFITRSLATEGEEIFSIYGIAPTFEGIRFGSQVCWRLILVILVSLGFIASTTSAEIKAAVEYCFKKVPFIPEKQVSTMLSLLLRFIPTILNQVQQTLDAQRSRCVEMRKNPLYRLTKFTIPLLRRIFLNGDQLAIAMASRCYNENRTTRELVSSSLDWTALSLLSVLTVIMQII